MKACTQIFLALAAVFTGYTLKVFYDLSSSRPLPHFDIDAYWGAGAKSEQHKPNAAINPFTVDFAQRTPNPIAALQKDLNKTLLLQPPLEGVGFEYGVNSASLHELVRIWREDYLPRWEERQTFLNQFPQFTTQIQGLKIHFIHAKPNAKDSAGKTVIPLIILHGWPGSVREHYAVTAKLIRANPLLDVVFEVIVPSLPGYGFSQAPAKTGFGPAEMAVVMRNLMIRLGHTRFMVQGGDWGSLVGSNIATIFPENVIAFHATACFINTPLSNLKGFVAGFLPNQFIPSPEMAVYHFPASEKFIFMIEESGYMHIQATKPDTIGTVLSGNPIGLFAYLLEKFSTWTKPHYRQLQDGGWSKLGDDYKDAILDNIMIYHLTNSITTSQRLYAEAFTFRELGLEMDRVPTSVPFGHARFRHELVQALDWQITDKFTNLVHSTYLPDGGHFASMEQTQMFYDDFVAFVKTVRNA